MRWLSVLVCGILVIGFVHGCGARVEVAKARVKERIDSLLGTLDVKRKEIEIGMKGLTKGINGLRRAKIKAQVSGEQIGRQAKPHEGKLASMDVALKTLRGHLEAAGPVEIAGRNYSPQEIHDMTERVLQARKATAAQVEAFHESQSRLAKVVSTLDTQAAGCRHPPDSNRGATGRDRFQSDRPYGNAAIGRGDGG